MSPSALSISLGIASRLLRPSPRDPVRHCSLCARGGSFLMMEIRSAGFSEWEKTTQAHRPASARLAVKGIPPRGRLVRAHRGGPRERKGISRCGGLGRLSDRYSFARRRRHTDDQARARSGYRIPLRSLIAKGIDNLLAVGRCLSATHEASAAIRVTPIAMAIGEAGGTLAALATQGSRTPAEIPAENVRQVLAANGALVTWQRDQ